MQSHLGVNDWAGSLTHTLANVYSRGKKDVKMKTDPVHTVDGGIKNNNDSLG